MAKNNNQDTDSLPLTPEEMKAIGEIELGPSRHEQFLNRHYKKLIVALLVFMLLASGAIVYGTWRARQESEAAAAIMAAMRVTSRVSDAGEYDMAQLDKILAEYPGTKAAATARLLRGMQLLAGGQQEQGIQALESVIAGADNDLLRLRAQVTLATYYMDGGDAAKAMEYWQAVSRVGSSPWEPLALLTMGDIAAQQGDDTMAKAYYTKLTENCPSSPLRGVAHQRILLLGVDAPIPVAQPPANEQQAPVLQEWQPNIPGTLAPTAP